MENWQDNELRNLYRKNGIYKILKTINGTTHVFGVFHDLEKAISYRDLFELSDWNINLKGITDTSNSPLVTETPVTTNVPKPIKHEPEIRKPIVDEVEIEPEIINSPVEVITEKIEEEPIELSDTIDESIDDYIVKAEITDDDEIIEDHIIDDIDESVMDPFDDKYIYFYKDKGYIIQKKINDKIEYFGQYNTLDEAIKVRDYFEKNNWPVNERLKFTKGNEKKYIHQTKDGYYAVQKKIKDKLISFGRYYTLEDAQKVRDYFQTNGWNVDEKNKFKNQQVNKTKENPKRFIQQWGKNYVIRKGINGKLTDFGKYPSLDDAITARNYFEEHGWNTDDIKLFKDLQYTRTNDNPKRFIVQTGNTYTVRRNSVHFGSFNNLDDAMEARDFLEEHDFSLEYKDKYAKKNQPESENYFENHKLF